jgi:hypothetical protein
MTAKIRAFFYVLAVAAAFAFSADAQTVTGSIGNGTITRGGSARATVYLNIPGGLHVNSNRPGSEYAIPTTVRASGRGVRVSAVAYPRGKNQKFEFSQERINVYEGRPAFTFNVTVPSGFKGNVVRVNVAVRFQACTNEVCYPPRSQNVTLSARVI